MKSAAKLFIFFAFIGLVLSSCRVFNPSVMIRTKRNYPYTMGEDSLPSEYIIQKGDLLNIRLFSNEGFRIVDIGMLENQTNQQVGRQNQDFISYRVESDSAINLPIIGRTDIAGMDLKEAELMLEDKYRSYYNDPYVVLNALNRRVVVFPGEGGAAKVVQIQNEYTTVIEALALAGGISSGGKAHRIKVVRGDMNNPEIYNLDLSTVEGLDEANMYYVKSNDIIYVEPSYFVGSTILTTTTQILGFITSSLLTYLLINQL